MPLKSKRWWAESRISNEEHNLWDFFSWLLAHLATPFAAASTEMMSRPSNDNFAFTQREPSLLSVKFHHAKLLTEYFYDLCLTSRLFLEMMDTEKTNQVSAEWRIFLSKRSEAEGRVELRIYFWTEFIFFAFYTPSKPCYVWLRAFGLAPLAQFPD